MSQDPAEIASLGSPFRVGDCLEVSGSSGSDGTFYVTGVDTGRGASRTSVVRVRSCPECQSVYGDLHPEGECRTGTVERIMES